MARSAITRNQKVPCTLLVILFVLNPTVASSASNNQAIFVFGDSLFDAGNNPHYRPDQYFPTMHYPFGMSVNGASGRLSDGLLVPDILAKHAGLAPVPPCLGLGANEVPMAGCNAASAGSGAQDHHPNVLNLREQIRTFKEIVGRIEEEVGEKRKVREMLNKAVFLLSVGGNDYFSFSTNNRNATDAEIDLHIHSVLPIIMEALNDIYEMGGRKFAFQDVGPLGCYPTFKLLQGLIHGCDEFALKVASMHNSALRTTLRHWSTSYPFTDVKYGVFDYFHQLKDRMFHPAKYDFLVGDMACCGGYGGYLNGRGCGRGVYFLCSNPSAFVLFDGAHTTQKLNGQLAELMWSGNESIIGPYNVQQLFEHDSSNLKLLVDGEI